MATFIPRTALFQFFFFICIVSLDLEPRLSWKAKAAAELGLGSNLNLQKSYALSVGQEAINESIFIQSHDPVNIVFV